MSMTRKQLEDTIAISEDIIARAREVLREMDYENVWERTNWGSSRVVSTKRKKPLDAHLGGPAPAALKRRSMDATRLFAQLRKYQ